MVPSQDRVFSLLCCHGRHCMVHVRNCVLPEPDDGNRHGTGSDPRPQLAAAILALVSTLISSSQNFPTIFKFITYAYWSLEGLVVGEAMELRGVWLITRCAALSYLGLDIKNFSDNGQDRVASVLAQSEHRRGDDRGVCCKRLFEEAFRTYSWKLLQLIQVTRVPASPAVLASDEALHMWEAAEGGQGLDVHEKTRCCSHSSPQSYLAGDLGVCLTRVTEERVDES
eukprot:scaffold121_cov412-Prasinococcus_capsulatus_cf.AAC.15